MPFVFSQNVNFVNGKITIQGPEGKTLISAFLTITFPMSTEIMSAIVGIADNQNEITGWEKSAALNQTVWVNAVGFLIVL